MLELSRTQGRKDARQREQAGGGMRGLLRSVVGLPRGGGSDADGPAKPKKIDRSIRGLHRLAAANIPATEKRTPS